MLVGVKAYNHADRPGLEYTEHGGEELECKLRVAACPVGAISPDGPYNFSACYTPNYRDFLGGFTDRVGQVADRKCFPS